MDAAPPRRFPVLAETDRANQRASAAIRQNLPQAKRSGGVAISHETQPEVKDNGGLCGESITT